MDTESTRQHEAAASSTRHTGPTADRYHAALQRYVEAVSVHPHESARPAEHVGFPPSTVADVMRREVVTAYEGALFKEIAQALARNGIEAVPVIDDERRVVGVVTASDLLARLAGTHPAPRGHRLSAHGESTRKEHGTTARELMTAPPITITPHARIADAARLAARSRVRTLPVVDRTGRLAGTVSRGDLMRLFLRDDRDILADIERDVLRRTENRALGDVTVAVKEGVVELSGTIATAGIGTALAARIRHVPGVVDVHDHLTHEVQYTLNRDLAARTAPGRQAHHG